MKKLILMLEQMPDGRVVITSDPPFEEVVGWARRNKKLDSAQHYLMAAWTAILREQVHAGNTERDDSHAIKH